MTNYEVLFLQNRRMSVSFSELGLVTVDWPGELQLANDRVLKTTLEKAHPCQVMPTSTTSPIIFAPDPDRFQPNDANHIGAGCLVKDGRTTSVSFTVDEYPKEFSGIPLFCLVEAKKQMLSLQPDHLLRTIPSPKAPHIRNRRRAMLLVIRLLIGLALSLPSARKATNALGFFTALACFTLRGCR